MNSDRRFDDLFNLVADPAFLLVAWGRVRGQQGCTGQPGSTGIPRVVCRAVDGCRGLPRPVAGLVEGPQLPSTPGPRADDSQGGRQVASARDRPRSPTGWCSSPGSTTGSSPPHWPTKPTPIPDHTACNQQQPPTNTPWTTSPTNKDSPPENQNLTQKNSGFAGFSPLGLVGALSLIDRCGGAECIQLG